MANISTEGIKNPAGNVTISVVNNGDVAVILGDAAGANKFSVQDSGSVEKMSVNSNGDVVIEGDLKVNGTYSTFETLNHRIEDNLLNLNYQAVGVTLQSGGFFIQRADFAVTAAPVAGTAGLTHRQLIWNEANAVWQIQAVDSALTPIPYSSGTPGTAYGATNPNLATRGAATASSGASQIGVFDDLTFTYVAAPGEVQTAIKQLDTAAAVLFGKTGTAAIASGVATKAIVFPVAFPAACEQVIVTMDNITDVGPNVLVPEVTVKAAAGFTVSFSGATDTANYMLHWMAYGT